jgi:hypothetical protein
LFPELSELVPLYPASGDMNGKLCKNLVSKLIHRRQKKMDCIFIYEEDVKPVQSLLTFACLFEALLIHIQELASTGDHELASGD